MNKNKLFNKAAFVCALIATSGAAQAGYEIKLSETDSITFGASSRLMADMSMVMSLIVILDRRWHKAA